MGQQGIGFIEPSGQLMDASFWSFILGRVVIEDLYFSSTWQPGHRPGPHVRGAAWSLTLGGFDLLE